MKLFDPGMIRSHYKMVGLLGSFYSRVKMKLTLPPTNKCPIVIIKKWWDGDLDFL